MLRFIIQAVIFFALLVGGAYALDFLYNLITNFIDTFKTLH